jgi:hypothetical protein
VNTPQNPKWKDESKDILAEAQSVQDAIAKLNQMKELTTIDSKSCFLKRGDTSQLDFGDGCVVKIFF